MLPVVADTCDSAGLTEAVAAAERAFGGLDAAIAVAGVVAGGVPLWEQPEQEVRAVLDVDLLGLRQHQDAGGKIIHGAPNTTSSVFAKSISKDGGRSTYRGLLDIADGATGTRSKVVCDALLLDEDSRSDTYPTIKVGESDADMGHEATVSKVGDDMLFYLQSRGLSEEEASKMIVNGFIEPVTKELPMEYAVELNRLIELQMEGSIG